jgi:hypothetical protein
MVLPLVSKLSKLSASQHAMPYQPADGVVVPEMRQGQAGRHTTALGCLARGMVRLAASVTACSLWRKFNSSQGVITQQ